MKNIALLLFLILLLNCSQSQNKSKDREEFRKVYKEYLSSFSQEDIDKLQLIDKIESFTVKSIDGKK
jgi:hypothetical protein